MNRTKRNDLGEKIRNRLSKSGSPIHSLIVIVVIFGLVLWPEHTFALTFSYAAIIIFLAGGLIPQILAINYFKNDPKLEKFFVFFTRDSEGKTYDYYSIMGRIQAGYGMGMLLILITAFFKAFC